MRKLFRRLQHLFRSRQIERDLIEELESHRAMQQARLEASGVPASDAAYASRRALGNTTLAREDARSVWIWPWLDSVRQDVMYALRALGRNPGFSAAVILVTSFGIGATTSVFGLVDGLVLKPLPVRNPERLVYVANPSYSYPVFSELRARGTEIFSGFFAWNLDSANVDWTGELEPAEILTAAGDFYSTLGIQPAVGRTFSAEDDRPGGGANGLVAVISYACWQRRFGGDSSVVGRIVRIERQPFTIVGVAPRGFFGVVAGLAPEITIPLTTLQDARALASTTSSWVHLMGRLRDGLSQEQANAAFQRIWPAVLEATTNPGMPADRRARYLGTKTTLEAGAAGFSRVRRQFAEPLWILFALVGLVFAVACASVANLLLARGVARQREIAVRLAIGASRARLVRQLFTESLVSAAIAAGLSVLFAAWAGGGLIAMMAWREQPIVLDVSPNWRIMLFALVLTLVTVILCSVLPAFRSTHIGPSATLKETGPAARSILRRWSLGKLLVVSQVAVTMVLLVGAALFVRSLTTVLAQNAGFDRGKVLVVATDAEVGGYEGERLSSYYAQLRERLAGIPGVESASLSMKPPISNEEGNWTQSIAVDGGPTTEESVALRALQRDLVRLFRRRSARGCCGDGTSVPPILADEHGSRHRQRVAGAAVLPERESNWPPHHHRAKRSPPERWRSSVSSRMRSIRRCRSRRAVSRIFRSRRRAWIGIFLPRSAPVGRPLGDRRADQERGAHAGWRRAGQDRDRDRSNPRVARQGAGHGAAGVRAGLHGARARVCRAVWSPRVRGVASGEGDRPAARARRDPRRRCCGPSSATA